jgi:ribonuclease T2
MKLLRLAVLTPLVFLSCSTPPQSRQQAQVQSAPNRQLPPRMQAQGNFDYYLLNLSWSPEFCFDKPDNPQCAGHFGFVVHGLWPQFQNGGYPENCGAQPGPSNPNQMLDIMPDLHLIQHEWQTHGTCTGLQADDYFALIRRIYSSIRIPQEFVGTPQQLNISPGQIKQRFEQLNPGLSDAGIEVSCRGPYFTALEICYTKDGAPTACTGVRDCTAPTVRVPKVR